MKRSITQLFGSRVALEVIEEKYEGILVKPPTDTQCHVLARVVATGDKVTQDIKKGDVLFWQTNAMIQAHCSYMLNKMLVYVLLTGDMVAKVTNQKIDEQNFQCIGDWCLVKRTVVQPSKLIIVPDTAVDANAETLVKWTLAQKGNTVEACMEIGDEVMLDRTRVNPVELGGVRFGYIHKNFVIGTLSS